MNSVRSLAAVTALLLSTRAWAQSASPSPLGCVRASVGSLQFAAPSSSVATVAAPYVPALDVGSFTIEWWQWMGSQAGNTPIIFAIQGPAGGTLLGVSMESTAVLWALSGALTSTYTPLLCTWQHMAVTRSGNSLVLFAAGSVAATWTVAAAANFTGAALSIGGNGTASRAYTGLISNLRIVVGSALYTSLGAPFAPPNGPPSPIPGTALLLAALSAGAPLADSSFIGVPVSGTGVAWNAAGPFSCSATGAGSLAFNYSAGTVSCSVTRASACRRSPPFPRPRSSLRCRNPRPTLGPSPLP